MRPRVSARPAAARARILLWIPFFTGIGFLLGGGAPASGESALRLPPPSRFGEVSAATYDEEGHPVGPASMRAEALPGDRVRLVVRSGFDEAPRTQAAAILERVPGERALRIVSQESRSFNERGEPMGVLAIDHERRIARCVPAPGSGNAEQRFELPEADRVANVPLTLLFRKLATGEVDEVSFQIFVCTGGPRLVDARARRVDEGTGADAGEGPHLVEISYDLDFGPILSSLARAFVPRMSIWFDADDPGAWVGHRIPLYGRGPNVLVVRTGYAPELLSASP